MLFPMVLHCAFGHGAQFNSNGQHISGPGSGSLKSYETLLDGNTLTVYGGGNNHFNQFNSWESFSLFCLKKFILHYLFFLITCSKPPTNLHVPALFSDGMVLQRDTTVILGQSLPLSNVQLHPTWSQKLQQNQIQMDFGKFNFYYKRSKNHTLTIKSGKTR